MFDPVHVLKILRNILERSRIDNQDKNTGNCLMLEHQAIAWDFIEKCYDEDQLDDAVFKRFYDLTAQVVKLDNFSKMKVNYALKVTVNSFKTYPSLSSIFLSWALEEGGGNLKYRNTQTNTTLCKETYLLKNFFTCVSLGESFLLLYFLRLHSPGYFLHEAFFSPFV